MPSSGADMQGGGGDLLSALLSGMMSGASQGGMPQGGMPQSGGGDLLSALLGGMMGGGMGASQGAIPSAGMSQSGGGSGLSGLAAIVAPVLGNLLINGLQSAMAGAGAGAGGRQVDMATAQQAVMDQAERIVPQQVVQDISRQLDVPQDHVYVGGMYLVGKLNRAAQAHKMPPQQLMAGLRSGEIRMDTRPLAVEFSKESGVDPREAHALMQALSMSMGIKPSR